MAGLLLDKRLVPSECCEDSRRAQSNYVIEIVIDYSKNFAIVTDDGFAMML